MKFIARALSILIFLVCVTWCFNLRDPHLLPIRDQEILIIIALLALLLVISWAVKNHTWKQLQIAAAVGMLLFATASEVRFHLRKEQLLSAPDNSVKTINRRLIVGFNDYEEIGMLAKNGIAGIFLTKRNIENMGRDQLRSRISHLQALRAKQGLPPLFVTTDQEGGPVSRMSPLVDRQPPLSKLVTEENAEQKAFDYGKLQGDQLRALGVNVNFSPVVDLKPAQASGSLDFHTRIRSRAISHKPEEVVTIADAYIRGLNEAGVIATLKHFPGLLRVEEDTHHFAAHLDTKTSILEKTDWLPFTQLPAHTDSWLMLSHVILTEIDPDNPVSTSHTVVNQLLRKKLGFNGVLITDDLTMGATYNRGFCQSVRDAYDAKVDYLLLAYDYEKYYEAVDCITDQTNSAATIP
jgi:beta-N-acetylhexosaminidase